MGEGLKKKTKKTMFLEKGEDERENKWAEPG